MKKDNDPLELLTAEEIIAEFPKTARRWKWTTAKLVMLWRTGALDAVWNNSLKRHMFTRGSIIEYVKLIHKRLQSGLNDVHDDIKYL